MKSFPTKAWSGEWWVKAIADMSDNNNIFKHYKKKVKYV